MEGEKSDNGQAKTKSADSTGKVLSVAVPAIVGAVALPFIASAAALSTAVIGGIAGAAVGIGYMAGKNSQNGVKEG